MTLLLIIVFIEFLIALFLCKGDYFRPGFLFSAVMLCSVISATYLSFVWKFKVEVVVLFLYSFAILIVIVIDQIISMSATINRNSVEIIKIDTPIIFDTIVIMIGIVTIMWHIEYLRSTFGAGSLLAIATQYRQSIVWESLESFIPSGLNRLMNFLRLFAYIYTYIIINNALVSLNKKRLVIRIIPVLLYCIDSMLTGARGYIIYLIIAAVTYAYVLIQRQNGWNTTQGFKSIKKIAYVFLISAFLFVFIGSYLGRSSNGSFFYKISFYLGGGIGLFNDYIQTGGIESPAFGAVTFVGLYSYLNKFGFPDYSNYWQFEFRHNWGNVYTAIRRYYQDFGITGVIICMMIFAIFFAWFYRFVKKDAKVHLIDVKLLLYGMMIRSVTLFFIDDELFVDFFTPATIKTIIEFYILIYILTSMKINKNSIRIKHIFNHN